MWRSWRKNRRTALRTVVLGFATAAILAPASTAGVVVGDLPQGYLPEVEAELALIDGSGGVTPTNLARAYEPRNGGVTPTNLARAYEPRHEGVTPTNLARAYEPGYLGVANPDGYQPQLRGDEPLIIRDGPDGYVERPAEVATAAASGSSIDWDQVASGFALGVLLSALCAVVLLVSRRRMRVAHF